MLLSGLVLSPGPDIADELAWMGEKRKEKFIEHVSFACTGLWVEAARARSTVAMPGFLQKARLCPQLALVPRNPENEKAPCSQPTHSAPVTRVIARFGDEHVVVFTAKWKRNRGTHRKIWKLDRVKDIPCVCPAVS